MILFFIFIALIVFLFPIKEHLSDIDVLLKANECKKGCLSEDGQCHFGTDSMCYFNNVCYAFFDENGKLRSPCDKFDRRNKNIFQDCNNCRYCRLCIDKNKKTSCISQREFTCDKCPYSDLCADDYYKGKIKSN